MEELKTSRITTSILMVGVTILMVGCSGISKQDAAAAAQTMEITADVCKGLAEMHGRSDVAAYCATAGGAAELMDKLLSEASACQVPTATAAGAAVPADAGADAPGE